MSKRRTNDENDKRPRFALVPHPGCVCERCLMHASRGFDYTHVFDPHGPGKPKCKCRFVPGVKGVTKVEGYDPDECYSAWNVLKGVNAELERAERKASLKEMGATRDDVDAFLAALGGRLSEMYPDDVHDELVAHLEKQKRIRRRIDNATTISRRLYEGGADVVLNEAKILDEKLDDAWKKHIAGGGNRISYADSYAQFISDATGGKVSIEDFAKIEGKELQVARWLSDFMGHVVIRNPEKYKIAIGGNTSDMLIGDELWEQKRISSTNSRKIKKRVTEKLDRQGPNFIVDLSVSQMDVLDAEIAIAELLDDDAVKKIVLIENGRARLFVK